jgi:hypothetical protein
MPRKHLLSDECQGASTTNPALYLGQYGDNPAIIQNSLAYHAAEFGMRSEICVKTREYFERETNQLLFRIRHMVNIGNRLILCD